LATYRWEGTESIYILNVVEEYNDIYIEIINYVEWKLEITINARKIISTLSVPLENTEWKVMKNMKWGTLIKKTYNINSIGWLTE